MSVVAFRKLHYLANALQRSHSLNEDNKTPSNVITLALLNQQLASTISQTLLAGNVTKDLNQSRDTNMFEFIDWTQAEMLAKDVSTGGRIILIIKNHTKKCKTK